MLKYSVQNVQTCLRQFPFLEARMCMLTSEIFRTSTNVAEFREHLFTRVFLLRNFTRFTLNMTTPNEFTMTT